MWIWFVLSVVVLVAVAAYVLTPFLLKRRSKTSPTELAKMRDAVYRQIKELQAEPDGANRHKAQIEELKLQAAKLLLRLDKAAKEQARITSLEEEVAKIDKN